MTYDCITPSAARGILEAVYWHPGIKYIIDEKDEVLGEENVYMLKDHLPDIEMIIVTVVDEYDKIREELKKRVLNAIIISVDDLINKKGDIMDE